MDTEHKGKRPGGWKRRLQDLIDANNERHSTRDKVVGHKTQDERATSLFRIFKRLRAMGFNLDDPGHLGGGHIGWLMRDWTADATLKAELATRGVRYEPREEPLSPAYIQQLSFLRVAAGWICKPGLALPADAYVAQHLVTRQTTPHAPLGCLPSDDLPYGRQRRPEAGEAEPPGQPNHVGER